MDPVLELRSLVNEFESDYKKHAKGNFAAGKRARQRLQEIRALCFSLRLNIVEERKPKP